jgi:Flp pilus assembly pilin Flp
MNSVRWATFLRDEVGQDLAEYCLITAFLALLALGIYYRLSGGIQDLWSTANSTLVTAPAQGSGATVATNPVQPAHP